MPFLFTNLTSRYHSWLATHISNDIDERMCHCVGQRVWRCLIEALRNGTNAIAITEEADIPQHVDRDLRILTNEGDHR